MDAAASLHSGEDNREREREGKKDIYVQGGAKENSPTRKTDRKMEQSLSWSQQESGHIFVPSFSQPSLSSNETLASLSGALNEGTLGEARGVR